VKDIKEKVSKKLKHQLCVMQVEWKERMRRGGGRGIGKDSVNLSPANFFSPAVPENMRGLLHLSAGLVKAFSWLSIREGCFLAVKYRKRI
jgi:hypothetical protein